HHHGHGSCGAGAPHRHLYVELQRGSVLRPPRHGGQPAALGLEPESHRADPAVTALPPAGSRAEGRGSAAAAAVAADRDQIEGYEGSRRIRRSCCLCSGSKQLTTFTSITSFPSTTMSGRYAFGILTPACTGSRLRSDTTWCPAALRSMTNRRR